MVCIYTIFISIFFYCIHIYINTVRRFSLSQFFFPMNEDDTYAMRWCCTHLYLIIITGCDDVNLICVRVFFYVYDVESRDGNHLQKTITSSCVLARAWEDDDNDDDDEDDAPSSLEIYLLLLCAALRFQLYFLEIIFTRIISTDYTCIDLFFFFFIFFFRSSLSSFFLSLSSSISNIDV